MWMLMTSPFMTLHKAIPLNAHKRQPHTAAQSRTPAQELMGWEAANMSVEQRMPLIEQLRRAVWLMGTKSLLWSLRGVSQRSARSSTVDKFNDVSSVLFKVVFPCVLLCWRARVARRSCGLAYRSTNTLARTFAWLGCGWRGEIEDVLERTQTFVSGRCLLHTWQAWHFPLRLNSCHGSDSAI